MRDHPTSAKDGGFYGWPYNYYGAHLDPRLMPQRPDLVAKAIVPNHALSSHVAPLGLACNSGARLSDAYRDGAFIGEHGSWDTAARSPVLLTGARHQAVQGLLIADDVGNAVWHVTAASSR